MAITFKRNPSWGEEMNQAADIIEEAEKLNNIASAEDEKSLIDAWIDFFSYLPQLWGPNGDAAKEALHNTLDSIVNHNKELDEAMKLLGYGGTNTVPTAGHQTDYNPFTPQMSDPLVIDADKDGFISTVALEDSEVYFDLTGNGVKTRTSWVKGNDAILVYDENEDGQIGGISEVFGNATTSGFDELRNTIDSNYDNKIDRKDILFSRLQLWHDYDQDGSVDEGELKSLKEEGITSIDLNSVQTTIETNGHLISEASHYYNTDGDKELVADIHLAYDARDTIIDLVQQKDFTIDPTTLNLPNLRGYGLVVDSFIAYQILFTCKPFSIQKALHVKIQNTLKGANDGDEIKVA